MQVISRYTACRLFDIKEGLSITVGGPSKLVDRIEAAGLCRRRANPDDRRSQIIELMLAGRRLLAKATKSFEDELQTRLESVVSGRTLDRFGATLMRLRAAHRGVTSHEQVARRREVTLAAGSSRGSDTRLGAVAYAFTRSP